MSSTKEDRRMQTIPAQKPRRPQQKRGHIDLRKLVSTRRGSALVAGVTALLATAVIMVFLHQYRQSLNAGKGEATVLVARNLIPKGSSGTVIAEKSIFQTAQVRKSDLKNGAVSDPGVLHGRVASQDIYPGQQLVVGDFVPATGGVRDHIVATDRAISLPLDNSHGMIGDVQAGDRVDIFYGTGASGPLAGPTQARSVVMPLVRNLLVLRAPKKALTGGLGGANNSQVVVLRGSDAQSEKLAFASDNGQIWLVLRPKIGSSDSKLPVVVDDRALLIGAAKAAR
jgi:Flp pilus assembly protein CpaB